MHDYSSTKKIPEQLRVLFNLAIFSGLRKGELLRLEWSDIDFQAECITARKTVTVVNKEQICKKPKSKKSSRTVAIPHPLILRLQALRESRDEYQASLNDFWRGSDWVFIQIDGRMMNYSTPYKAFRDILKRYNDGRPQQEQLPLTPFHGLRHTSATLLIATKQDVKTVSNRLGHAQTSTTMNIYAHALRKNDRDAADALEELLSKQK